MSARPTRSACRCRCRLRSGTTGVDPPIDLRAAFERAYQASFSRLLPGVPATIVNLRTAAIGRRPHFDLAALAPEAAASIEKARLGTRPVWFDGGWHDAAIYARLDLPVGAVDRRAGHARAAGRDDGHRPGARRAGRSLRQRHRGARRMSEAAIPVGRTALLIVDLQNDFLHPEGAYGRAGQGAAEIAALPARLKPLADLLRAKGG